MDQMRQTREETEETKQMLLIIGSLLWTKLNIFSDRIIITDEEAFPAAQRNPVWEEMDIL